MSFYLGIMDSLKEDKIRVNGLGIEKWYNSIKDTDRIVATLDICRNDESYVGQSYLDPPENMTDEGYKKITDDEYEKYNGMNQGDFLKELNQLADSEDTGDNVLFRAIIHAYYSKDISDWPHKHEGNIITEGIEKDDCVLLVDNHGQRKLNGFIKQMMEKRPREIYILRDDQLYNVCLDTYELLQSEDSVSEADFNTVIVDICSCHPKNIDKYLEKIFSTVNTDNAHDIALKAPRFVVDPRIVFEAYPITLYGTSQYPKKTKVICTPK
ncbi:MAG: hypothetical protein KAH93_02975 [Candidatus Aenigmarchaeota archaeon]|nr:hypothetical protein [Candidatus Aenigmarchaeota archaeon]